MMHSKAIVLALLAAVMAAPASGESLEPKSDDVFHYSVIDAMRNGVYLGDLTVAASSRHGDFGLGTFNNLDGEMIAVDGVVYRIAPDGMVAPAEPERKIPFAAFAFFTSDAREDVTVTGGYDDLQQALIAKLATRNVPHAIRIRGTFPEIVVGGANPVSDSDRTPLAELMKARPQYSGYDVTGTIVAFYYPTYVGGVDLSPFHMHFISDDKRMGGHIMAMRLVDTPLAVELDAKTGVDIELPQNREAFKAPWANTAKEQKGY
jgi:acetolactate decarboxylase